MIPPLIELRKVAFQRNRQTIFSDVNLTLDCGERLALLGSNGTGKTSLLHLLVGLNAATEGEVLVFGERCQLECDFVSVRQKVGLLFQDSDDQLFCPTVIEDVAFGPLNQGLNAVAAQEKAKAVLNSLGLEPLQNRVTHRLSGGQKRLVALATVLAMEPEVLLLDEPTNALDEASKERLLCLLESLDQTMVIVSHDQKVIERLANRAVIMKEGRLVDAIIHRHPHHHEHSHLHVHEKEALMTHDENEHQDHHISAIND